MTGFCDHLIVSHIIYILLNHKYFVNHLTQSSSCHKIHHNLQNIILTQITHPNQSTKSTSTRQDLSIIKQFITRVEQSTQKQSQVREISPKAVKTSNNNGHLIVCDYFPYDNKQLSSQTSLMLNH